jgi:hypothetical protein
VDFIDQQICKLSVSPPADEICKYLAISPTIAPTLRSPSPTSDEDSPGLDITGDADPSEQQDDNIEANSRAIQITNTGIVVATSIKLGPMRMEIMKGEDYTVGLPGGLESMDDLSISNEGFLFGLSVFTPALCSFDMMQDEGPI